ncbi:MAG: flagellar hook-basal body complex protein FliE [Planctomycetaceae bacterium]|nr:flagellar hook-basal body complex protein FliE [Planctomycetaceae bacterium]
MINFNPNVSSSMPVGMGSGGQASAKPQGNSDFADAINAVEKNISKVDDAQHSSDVSIQDLLTGKNEDINMVVTEVAKADMSFKLLVGVRNKLIEAYKQTMNMPI